MLLTKLYASPKKLVDYLGELKQQIRYPNVLLVFNHGLGDAIGFMNIVETLRELFPNFVFSVGLHPMIPNQVLDPTTFKVLLDVKNPTINPYIPGSYESIYGSTHEREYDLVAEIDYIEPPLNYTNIKLQFCSEIEIGIKAQIDYFKWKSTRFVERNKDSNLVGFHYISNSCIDRKKIYDEEAAAVWQEIKDAGYQPFEVHMNKGAFHTQREDVPKWMKDTETLRYSTGDLTTILNKICECKYFIGVDSGPLAAAVRILGPRKTICIERQRYLQRYIPDTPGFYKVNMSYENNTFQKGAIKEVLRLVNEQQNKVIEEVKQAIY